MKIVSKYAVSFLLAVVLSLLTACGGGGSGLGFGTAGVTGVTGVTGVSSAPTTTTSYSLPVYSAFENLPFSQTVVVGQVGVSFARVSRVNVGSSLPVTRLVFTNLSPVYPQGGQAYKYPLAWVFPNKDLELWDTTGDMKSRVPYYISYEEEKIIVTFESGYYGTNRKDILTLTSTVAPYASQLTMNLSLTEVVYQQPSDENILVSGSAITTIKWIPLPLVESFSPKITYYPWVSAVVTSANVIVRCPTDGFTRDTCYLVGVETIVIGGRDIMLSDGYHLYNKKVNGDVSSFSTSFGVAPGESAPLSFNVITTNSAVTAEISKMIFSVGGVMVVPIVIYNYMTCEGVLEPLARQQCANQQGGKG